MRKTQSRYVFNTAVGATKQGEKNDCAIRALVNAAGIDYDTAHCLIKDAGRKEGKGTPWHALFTVYEKFGFKAKCVFGTTLTAETVKLYRPEIPRFSGINLENILKVLKKDRNYILCIRGHAFAVVKGEIVDKGALKANSYVSALFSDRESLFD